MTNRRVNVLLAVIGGTVVIGGLLAAGGAWFALSVLQHQPADESSAVAVFDATRAQFKGARPVFALRSELRSEGPVLTRPVPATTPGVLQTLHVLSWEPEDQALLQADLPFSVLRLQDLLSPWLAEILSRPQHRVTVTAVHISEVERFGPALLLDEALEDGTRVLVWTD